MEGGGGGGVGIESYRNDLKGVALGLGGGGKQTKNLIFNLGVKIEGMIKLSVHTLQELE